MVRRAARNSATAFGGWAARLDRLLSGRRAAIACVAAALIVYGLESIAWPLHLGRDAGNYLTYWADMWDDRPVFPQVMLYRTPVAPLLFGPLLEYGGAWLTEAVMGLAFALSVLAVGAAAYSLRRAWGIAVVVALLLSPDYGELFREVSSDSVFAVVFALWVFLCVRAATHPSARGFALVGAGVALLVLTKPAGQALVLVALLPLFLPGSWRRRSAHAAACLAASVGLVAAWAAVNELRYDDFTVSRTVSAQLPLNRLFVRDRLVSPDNGPRSRELARHVRRELLTKEPYRSYGITLDAFFSSGSFRMYSDLVPLSDRVWGWSSDYSHLRAVGIETVRRHPWRYFRAVALDTLRQLDVANPTGAPRRQSAPPPGAPELVTVDGRRLPKPSEGEPIPRSYLWWGASTPDRRIWYTPDLAGEIRFRYPQDAEHWRRLSARVDRLAGKLPPRDGSATAAGALQQASRWYPSMLLWLAVGALAFALRRGRGLLVPTFLAVLGVVLVWSTMLSQAPAPQYRIPLDPVFVLFTVAAVIGQVSARREAVG
jgi:hypothetical protein